MHSLGARLGEWVICHRWRVIIATLVVVALAGSGMRLLIFNDDTRVWFSEKNPYLRAFEALERTYTKTDNVFFAIEAKNNNVFTRETLSALEELTHRAWKIPYSNRVDSITNYQHSYARGDDFIVSDLVRDARFLDDSDLENIRKIALNEPSLHDSLLSPKGDVTAVNVNIIRPSESTDELSRITQASKQLAAEISKKYPGIVIHLSGGIVFDQAFIDATQGDIRSLVPIMVMLMLGVTYLLLRSLVSTLAIVLIIGLSTITAMGLAGWIGIYMNPASGTAPTVILTLAVADSIHILMTMFHRLREGSTKHDAIIETMAVNLRPVFLTSLTTTIGFLSMNFSDAPPFHDLGNIVAMGVIAAFILSVTFLPAFMAVVPLGRESHHGIEHLDYHRLADFVVSRYRYVIFGTLAILVFLSTGILRIELDDNFIEYLDDRFEARLASDFIQERLTGFDYIDYSLSAGGEYAISSPAYLNKVEEFANWYRSQPGVVHVTVITDVFKRLNKNMHNDDAAYYRIPDNQDLAAQYLLLYEMSLPYGLDLNNRINVAKSATRATAILKGMTSKQVREMDNRAREWLKKNAPTSMLTHGTGLSIMFAHISKTNIDSMLLASVLALFLISFTLTIALRSFKIGIISLIPNLTPAFMAFGIWGVVFGQIGLAAAVIFALTLGIVVDDTVHFLSNYLYARRQLNMNAEQAIRRAFATVGTALVSTTIILVSGFCVLAFSGYKVNSDMGLLTLITISLALILDFIFLPALLLWIDGKASGGIEVTAESAEAAATEIRS